MLTELCQCCVIRRIATMTALVCYQGKKSHYTARFVVVSEAPEDIDRSFSREVASFGAPSGWSDGARRRVAAGSERDN